MSITKFLPYQPGSSALVLSFLVVPVPCLAPEHYRNLPYMLLDHHRLAELVGVVVDTILVPVLGLQSNVGGPVEQGR